MLRRKRINEYLLEKISDQRGRANILNELGTVYFLLGDARKAIEYYEQALDIDREIGDRSGEVVDLGNLGLAYAALGETHKAINCYELRLVIARETGTEGAEQMPAGTWDLSMRRRAISSKPPI